jgi:CBS domain-containing protein
VTSCAKDLVQDNFDARVTTARDVMTTEIHCCREDDDLAKAVRHMEELKVRPLPVINKSDERHISKLFSLMMQHRPRH